jgi:heme/copper-type cytochrome/quinol oxidase subunit 2
MHGSKDSAMSRALLLGGLTAAALSLVLAARRTEPETPRVIEIVADHDSRFRINGQESPTITAHAGEPLLLRITARKAKNRNRDGSIHGFALLHAKDRSRVPGWDFLLKPGVQEFTVNAPEEVGEYVVVCTVICSDDHDGMHMRFVVVP